MLCLPYSLLVLSALQFAGLFDWALSLVLVWFLGFFFCEVVLYQSDKIHCTWWITEQAEDLQFEKELCWIGYHRYCQIWVTWTEWTVINSLPLHNQNKIRTSNLKRRKFWSKRKNIAMEKQLKECFGWHPVSKLDAKFWPVSTRENIKFFIRKTI